MERVQSKCPYLCKSISNCFVKPTPNLGFFFGMVEKTQGLQQFPILTLNLARLEKLGASTCNGT
jgi:hypothetical protein